jgi:hypothetical protein
LIEVPLAVEKDLVLNLLGFLDVLVVKVLESHLVVLKGDVTVYKLLGEEMLVERDAVLFTLRHLLPNCFKTTRCDLSVDWIDVLVMFGFLLAFCRLVERAKLHHVLHIDELVLLNWTEPFVLAIGVWRVKWSWFESLFHHAVVAG